MTGQCKFDGNLFCFFLPPAKEERNHTHIAHIGKASRANAETKALPKSAILPLALTDNFWKNEIFCSSIDTIFANGQIEYQITLNTSF